MKEVENNALEERAFSTDPPDWMNLAIVEIGQQKP